MAKTKVKKSKEDLQALVLSPQQEEFLGYYLNVNSATFGNAYQSAVKAKYSKEYAESITHQMPAWLSENLGDTQMLGKAVKNLDKFLGMNTKDPLIGMFGPVMDKKTGKIYTKDNVGKMKIKADVTKFVAERLGRSKFGNDRGKTVVPIQINFNNDKEVYA